jgi:phosphonate metabolism-associated iron-containing alcohol dehydrogenase
MWQYRNPVEISFGAGALSRLAAALRGRTYCLVTYSERLFADLAGRLAASAGAPVLIVDTVATNPDFHMLAACCARFADVPAAPDVIVALGGGSVLDAAKVLAAARGDFTRVRRYLETGEGSLDPMPVIAIPTTAGTGSDVTCWATVWDTDAGKKYSLELPGLFPECTLIDPSLMLDLPRGLTVSTGLDALSHALESLWNRNANPVSTNHAVDAARIILDVLPAAVERPADIGLRSRMAEGALLAGLAFSNTRTALAHSLSYPITLRHGVPHGLACSFSLPLVMRSAIGADDACDAALRRIFGPDLDAAPEFLEGFLDRLGVSVDAADYGVEGSEWRTLVEVAFDGQRGRNFIGSKERIISEAV